MKQSPKLLRVVLYGGTSEQSFSWAGQPSKSICQFGVLILESMRLIKDQMLKRNLNYSIKITQKQFVVGEENLEFRHF